MWIMVALSIVAGAVPSDRADVAGRIRRTIVATCHIAADRLAVEQDGDPPFYTIALRGGAPLTAAQLGCFADRMAAGGDVGLSIDDERLSKAYDRLRQRRMLISARVDLGRLGLLGRVPRFDRRRETLGSFAVRLERLCGAKPHTVLRVVDGRITIRNDVPGRRSGAQPGRWFCVTDAALLSGHDPITVVAPPTPVPYIVY